MSDLQETDCMKQSPFSQVISSSANQQIPRIVYNQKVNHHAQKSAPFFLILSQINPVHATLFFLKSVLILSSVIFVCTVTPYIYNTL
jgi:hypothetical protein